MKKVHKLSVSVLKWTELPECSTRIKITKHWKKVTCARCKLKLKKGKK